jgi:hypothetical protein
MEHHSNHAPIMRPLRRPHNQARGGFVYRQKSDAPESLIGNRSDQALIRLYDTAGNVIETHEQAADFREV